MSLLLEFGQFRGKRMTLRDRCIEATAEIFRAVGHKEPFATTYATLAFDDVLAVLAEHAEMWDTGDVYQQERFKRDEGVFYIIPVEALKPTTEEART